jgi:hypothetical protein
MVRLTMCMSQDILPELLLLCKYWYDKQHHQTSVFVTHECGLSYLSGIKHMTEYLKFHWLSEKYTFGNPSLEVAFLRPSQSTAVLCSDGKR